MTQCCAQSIDTFCMFLTGNNCYLYVISGFCREVEENCALLGYYAARSGNFLQTFRDILSVPSSEFKKLLPLAA